MKSTASIVSNRVDDVVPALSAVELLTCRDKRGDLEHCNNGAIRQTALVNKLLLRAVNLAKIVETPCLRIRTRVNSSDHQEWTQADQPERKREPSLACG